MNSVAWADLRSLLLALAGLAAVFALMAAGIYFSWFPDIGTLRPLPRAPDALKGLQAQQLVERLTPPSGWYFQLEGRRLMLRPVDRPVPTEYVVNPTLETGLFLDLADPYVFASPDGKTHRYGLTIFCYQNKTCGYAKTFQSGAIAQPWLHLSAETKHKDKAQMQLEILRRLIVLAGGKSSLDRTKILARLEFDVSRLLLESR
jgi:hypothetical protein